MSTNFQLAGHHNQVSHPQKHLVPFVMTQTIDVTCNLEGWWALGLQPISPEAPHFCWSRLVLGSQPSLGLLDVSHCVCLAP